MQGTVAFHTLGCKLNFSETATIGRQFLDAGFEKRDFEEPADIYVINTCSVTDQANVKCRNVIRKALKQNPNAFIAVVGCYAQLKPQEIAAIPGVDLVLGANDKFRMLELVSSFTKTDNPCVYNSNIKEVNGFVDAYSLGDRTRSFLKIQDGCDYKCTFCTIPLARGKSRSDKLDNIVRNANLLAAKNIKEVVLTGVNIGDYGKDVPHSFLDVIQALDQVDGIARFRISSIEPNLLSDQIVQFVAGSARFMPHFHVPLQSGSNTLLAAMKRRYKRELYAEKVRLIKSYMPAACIGVDVIVGFPGESEANFMETVDFLEELDISYLHVFTYSERDNTEAIEMAHPVPVKERNRRNQILRNLSEKKRRAFYLAHLATHRIALFERSEKAGEMTGFTDNYIKITAPYDEGLTNTLQNVYLDQIDPELNVSVQLR